MQVTLTPELERIVKERLASGRYSSPTEVVKEALCLIAERDHGLEIRKEALRRDIQAGVDQLDRGEFVTPTKDQIIEGIDQRLRRER
jgi:antitoxin ParD1/3/4